MKAEVLDIVEGMRFSVGLDDIMQSVMNFTVKSLPKGSCKITVTMTSRKNNFLANASSALISYLLLMKSQITQGIKKIIDFNWKRNRLADA